MTALDARDRRDPLAGAVVLAASARVASTSTPRRPSPTGASSPRTPTAPSTRSAPGTGTCSGRATSGTYVYTAPAVWDKKVYVGTYDGKFYALDAATGETRWVREMPAAVHGAPTVMVGLVYLSTCSFCGHNGSRYAKSGPNGTFALDARTGKLVWTFPDGQYSPVVADRERVYVAGAAGVYGLVERTLAAERAGTPRRCRSAARRGTRSGRRGR